MKFISWNVNGFRAVMGKGFPEIFSDFDADCVCLQETKMQEGQAEFNPDGYDVFWNSAVKKGYSGVATVTRMKPLTVTRGIGCEKHDNEGRVLTTEFPDFFLVNVYTPNSQDGLKRLDYRMSWEEAFKQYVLDLDKRKPVIICGDMNVAHEEIDLNNPKTNRRNAGFTDEERSCMTSLLEAGFVDTFRHFYPDMKEVYSWWSYRNRAREKNIGWRIDYFLVSERLVPRLRNADILGHIYGSDHCPVLLEID